MLAVALPEIRADFGVSHASIGWLVSAYLIAMAVAQPLAGRLSDQLGRNRVFRAGLLGFLALSLGAAVAPSYWLLVTFRTGQALVGAAVIPTGMAMLRESLPVTRLAQSYGLTGSLISLSAAGGPLLGAAFIGVGSWRLLFLANIPLVVAALAAHAWLRYPGRAPTARPTPGLLDWPGVVLLSGGLVLLTLLLNSYRGGDVAFLGGVATAGALTGLTFVWQQRRTSRPVAGWDLFRIRSYRAATSHVLLTNLVMYTTLLTVPFFIREFQEHGTGTVGALLGVMSILVAVLAPISGRLADQHGRNVLIVAGSLVNFGAVLAIILVLRSDISSVVLAFPLAAVGVGVGLTTGSAQTAAIESVERGRAGTAAGTASMMRYFGSIVGVGLLAGILDTAAGPPDLEVFRAIFFVLIVIAGLAIVAATQVHRFPPEVVTEVGLGAPAESPRPRIAPGGAGQ